MSERGLSIRGNHSRLVRQNGKSNLKEDVKNIGFKVNYGNHRPIAIATRTDRSTVEKKGSFEVYRDSDADEGSENNENNVIHQIERRLKEEKVVEKQPVPAPLRQPLTTLKENVDFEDDDVFVACNSGATSTRDEFSNFGLEDDKLSQSTYTSAQEDIDNKSEYLTAVSDKFVHEDILYAAPEFADDIYLYMRERETKIRAKPTFISKQPDVSEEMRYILVDWLMDVTEEYQLHQESLHLACSLLDRTLSRFRVERHRLQLVGAAAMMIATKYEEIYPPALKDFVYLTDDCFTGKQFLMMERAILSELEFNVSAPTSQWFGARFARLQRANKKTCHAMEYLLDLSLLETNFVAFRPSYIAAACLCYANILTGPIPWSSELEEATGILAASLDKILRLLHKQFTEMPSREHQAAFIRYSSSEKSQVARLDAPASFFADD